MDPVRSSRGDYDEKIILVSFLYIYNKCAFFKARLLFDLPSYTIKTGPKRLLAFIKILSFPEAELAQAL
jgi:hypothetical protein